MKHEIPFDIRFYECGGDGKMLFSTLLNYMQEVAASHTIDLHITIPELLPRGFTWMLSRYHIVIDDYPVYTQPVIMSTWVAEHEGMLSIRDFQLLDAGCRSLARITSSWVLYDIHKKEIAQVDKVLPLDCVVKERAVNDLFHRLPKPDQTDNEVNFQVRMHDLDINRHVNNRVIVEWALESVPMDIVKSNTLKELEITFKGQAFYGTMIRSACQISKETEQTRCLHHITNNGTGETIAFVATKWEEKNS